MAIRREILLATAVTAAALLWDPLAHAADAKRVAAVVVAIGAASFAFFGRGARPRLDAMTSKLAIAFLALSALSALWGAPSAALDLATWCAAAVIATSAASMGRRQALTTARLAGAMTGGVLAGWALVSFAFGHRGFGVHGGQGNPNWLGLALALTLPLGIDLVIHLRSRSGERTGRTSAIAHLAAIAAVVQPAALYVSHSRVAWLASATSLAWLGYRAWSARAAVRPHVRALLALSVAASLGVALVAAIEHRPRAKTHVAAVVEDVHAPAASPEPEDVPMSRSLEGRRVIAERSLAAARHGGFFGAGLGHFGGAYLEAQGEALHRLPPRAASRGFLNATTAHNEPLQVAVESGPLAAVVFVLLLLFMFLEHRRVSAATSASALALAVTSLGDSPWRQPAVCLIAGLLAGVLAAPAIVQMRDHPNASPARRVFFGGIAVMLSLLLVPSSRAWLGARALEKAYAMDASPRRTALLRATRLDPNLADAWLALGAYELAEGRVDDAIAHLTRADALTPSVAARVALGEAHLANHAPDRARLTLLRALAFAPGSLRVRLALAETERQLAHLDEAKAHVDAAHAVAPFDPHVRELGDRVVEDMMDRPIARDDDTRID